MPGALLLLAGGTWLIVSYYGGCTAILQLPWLICFADTPPPQGGVSVQRTSSHEIDDRPAMNHGGKVERVPIREADTAVRFGLADFFR